MLLRHCTDGRARPMHYAALIVAALLVSACGSQPPAPAADVVAAAGDGAEPVVPAEVLTRFEQAVAALAGGDYTDAELQFEEFLLLYPDFPGAHTNLAIIHSHNGDDAAAAGAVDAALAIDPDFAPALNQKGLLLRKNGKFLEAEAAYLKAVTSTPDYALAHYNLGVLNELYLQRLEDALHHFEQYQALVGNDEQVEKWIADLTRRVAANQRTANVAD